MAVKDLLKVSSNNTTLFDELVVYKATKGEFILKDFRNKEEVLLGEKIEFLYVGRASQYVLVKKDRKTKEVIIKKSKLCKNPKNCEKEEGMKLVNFYFGVLFTDEGYIPCVLETKGAFRSGLIETKPKRGSVLVLSKGEEVEGENSNTYFEVNISSRELSDDENEDEALEKAVSVANQKLATIED